MYITFIKRNYKNINQDRVERHGKGKTATRQLSVNISSKLANLEALECSAGWCETPLEAHVLLFPFWE